ncbi:MAG: LuxR C-terminal-related transcriptional regulator [Cellulomonadaceae bacterium]|jgi:DNA-binding CsgD family transcriptional regulator/sugar-specific transcriptional regulator TrmB|nr:LuxR C-terminal-related transcriptional regulator [Cellulomonadaceae bacterium]
MAFEAFGISEIANQLYAQALKSPGQTLEAQSQILGIPLDEIAHGHRELIDNGLALPSAQGVVVVPKTAATEILISRQKIELITQNAHFELLKEFTAKQPEPSTEIEVIKGAPEIHERLRILSERTRFEVATFAPGGAQSPESMAASQARNSELFSRGVSSRSIYLSSARNDSTTLKHVEWLNCQGSEVRTAPTLPIRMIIADKATAVLPLDPTPGRGLQGIAVYHNKGVVLALQTLFEAIWATAAPLGQSRTLTKDTHGLSDDERVVLELLTVGRSTDDIAKQMGVSARTARRIVGTLMERLEARSPFEAGYQAVKRGWI